jgi:uncharacterized protein YgiM (DUF1202 family)
MASEPVQNPPSLSKRLMKQWRWVGVALVVVALAVLSKSANVDLGRAEQVDRCQVEVNVDVLNVRAGPSIDTQSVRTLSKGDVVDATAEITNGFRRLADNGWVATQFVTPNSHCG